MDTSKRAENEKTVVQDKPLAEPKRQRRTVEEKRRIVEETMVAGRSVARVARSHGVNANQVYAWKRQYLSGQSGGNGSVQLLPVRVRESSSAPVIPTKAERTASAAPGTIQVELRHAQVKIEGNADAELLRIVLESLRR
jgi:transposase